MAQKWTDLSSGNSGNRLQKVDNAAIHLSDGTLVFLDYDPAVPAVYLKYSSDHTTVSTIATLATTASGASNMFWVGSGATVVTASITLCRDASNNIYVVGPEGNAAGKIIAQAFTKGTGYSWTAQTLLTSSVTPSGFVVSNGTPVWCNIGGTGSHGLIMFGYKDNQGNLPYIVLDAGILLAGTGTPNLSSGTFTSGTVSTPAGFDLDSDGFGAANGIAVMPTSSTTTVAVYPWSVNSSGVVTIASALTGITSDTLSSTTKLRAIRYASNAWAVIYPSSSTSGHYMVARYSSTAQLTAGADSGAPTSMPLNGANLAWDAFLDPVTANQIWVIAQGASAVVYRLSCAVGSGVTWATSTTTDDTLSPWFAQGTADLRAVKKPTSPSVDWQAFAETASTPTYALLGDYTQFASAPATPTGLSPTGNPTLDRTISQTFSWTYNPTDGSACSASDIQWRQGAGAWTTVNIANGTPSYSFAANTFPAGSIEYQVRNYQAQGLVGPWSASSFFTAATPPGSPTITTPASGGTITSNPSTVTWSAPAQDDYQVRRVADLAGSPDTSTVYWDSGDVVNASARSLSVPFETNNRWEHVQVRIKSGGLWSTWADARADVSYTQPAVPTVALTPSSGAGTITVTVANPTPTGGQPTVDHNDIYRRVGATGAAIRVATGVANNGSWVDRTPGSGTDYQYQAVAFGSNTTSIAGAWAD